MRGAVILLAFSEQPQVALIAWYQVVEGNPSLIPWKPQEKLKTFETRSTASKPHFSYL